MQKLNIGFHSNAAHLLTGFGKNLRNVLLYLYKNHKDKFNFFEFANGCHKNDELLKYRPWTAFGTRPSEDFLYFLVSQQDNDDKKQVVLKAANYGFFTIDELMRENAIDVYFGIEDVWAHAGFREKLWWRHTNNFLWHTIDSLPVIEDAFEFAKDANLIKYFHPASFAANEINKVVPAKSEHLFNALRTDDFYPLKENEKKMWRQKFNIAEDEFLGIFVFRNQLRKQVAQLIHGFAKFKQKHGKGKLLLITNYAEPAWNIDKLRQEAGLANEDILTAYVCHHCGEFFVHPYVGNDVNCPICKAEKSCHTVNITRGLSEEQLNVCYNLADYCPHFCTSGGMEIPIYEAKLAGLPTLTNSYSCCSDAIVAGGIEVEHDVTFEQNTNFIKAATKIDDIARKIEQVFLINKQKRHELGMEGREYTLTYASEAYVGERILSYLKTCHKVDWSKIPKENEPNPDGLVNLETENDHEFIRELFINKFGRLPNQQEFEFWINKLKEVK